MNTTSIALIIKGFLSDVAGVTWRTVDSEIYEHKTYRGRFSKQQSSTYSIMLSDTHLSITTNYDENYNGNIEFNISEYSLEWIHDNRHSEWHSEYCPKRKIINFADPRLFEYLITIICLLMLEVKVPEFILKNLINKPKYRSMFKEDRMRFLKKKAKSVMDCEDVHNLLWT